MCIILQVELIRRDYVANNGWETFLSYEDPEQGIYEAKKIIVFPILPLFQISWLDCCV